MPIVSPAPTVASEVPGVAQAPVLTEAQSAALERAGFPPVMADVLHVEHAAEHESTQVI